MNKQTRSRRWLLTSAMAGCALTLSACGGGSSTPADNTSTPSGSTPAPASGTSYAIGSTIPTFNHPFFVAMRKGLEEEAKAQGATINVVDGKNDPQAQLSAIDTFAVKKVNALILCPTETKTLVPGVEKANQAKIPVITVNRVVDGGEVVTYVGADDKEGGKLQGEAVIEALPKGGKIVLLQGIIGSSPQRDREAGLEEALKGKAGYEIVQRTPYDFDRTKGVSAMETVLLKFPKGTIDVVVAQSDDGALAAADVCAQKGRSEIKIIGFNGESDAFKYIDEGKIYATILQDAETQGREAVKATIKHLKGETVTNPQITPLYLVNKKNLKEHKPAWESTSS
jgi:ribose transport system substrate-binding protein